MNPKEKFLDRIEQAFMILINRKDLLIGAALIYGGMPIVVTIFWKALTSIMVFDELFFAHSINLVSIVLGIHIWFSLILIQIGIVLGFIKYLSDLDKGLPVDLKGSLYCGMKKIWPACYTYYYIFLYTLLIPALFLIGGLLLIMLDLMQGKIGWSEGFQGAQYANIGIVLISVSFLLGIYFILYRGIKSAFAIYRAIDQNDFTKKSFEESVRITDNQWVRIFGNLIGVGILTGLTISIFNGIFSIDGSTLDMGSVLSMKEGDITSVKHVLQSISPFGIGIVLSSALSGVGGIFSIVFTYLFFKRLEVEDTETPVNTAL